MSKENKPRTAIFESEVCGLSTMAGPYGTIGWRRHGTGENFHGCVPVEELAGGEFYGGALIEVTVRVIKRGRPKRNPFWYGWRKKRSVA